MKERNILVFTDLDGSFLDHKSYDFSPALPALYRLKHLNAQVIPTTSKTLAEIEFLNLPFEGSAQIAENGTVIFDGEQQTCIGKNYREIIAFINKLDPHIRDHMKGFNDMSVEDVISHTSLPHNNAQLAKKRMGSEPFIWSGDEIAMNSLVGDAEKNGLAITKGGRFYHLMGGKGGKAAAIEMLLSAKHNAITIALGDGPNDAEMLAKVDYGIKIPNANGHDFIIENPRGEILEAPAEGPEGWNAAINDLLDRLCF